MGERIDIIITERGARVVRRNIESIGDSAERAQSGVKLLRRTLGLLGGAAAVRQLGRISDTFTSLQNRLRIVTNTTNELANVTEELFAISERTRVSFSAVADVYARTALSVRQLGISQEQTLQFTESLNQAVVISGATAQEATAALIQLGQGLASGALRGDELRSVLEQLPRVADVIADSLEVTRGELRLMGQAGKISAEVVLEAFKKAKDQLAEEFLTTIPTIGQAFSVLGTNVTKLVGEFNKSSGAATGLANSLILVAKNLGTVVDLLVLAAGVTATYFASFQIATLATFVTAQVQLAAAIAAGNAVLIGGVAAERAKTAASVATAAAEVQRTTAVVTATQAQLAHAVVVRGSTINEFARLALLRQITIQTTAQTAATNVLTAATARQTAVVGLATRAWRALTAVLLANPITAVLVGLSLVVGALFLFRRGTDEATLAMERQIAAGADLNTSLNDERIFTLKTAEAQLGLAVARREELSATLSQARAQRELELQALSTAAAQFESQTSSGPLGKTAGAGVSKDLNEAQVAARATQTEINRLNEALEQEGQNISRVGSLFRELRDELDPNVLSASEYAKVLKDLNNIINPMAEATREYEDLLKVLNTEHKEGAIVGDAYAIALERLEDSYRDQLDPIGSLVQKLRDKLAVDQEITANGRAAGQLLQVEQRLQREGISLTESQTQTIRQLLTASEALNAQRKTHGRSFQSIRDGLVQENALLRLNSRERDIGNRLLGIQASLKRDFRAGEAEELEALLRVNQALTTQAQVLEEIQSPLQTYTDQLAAVNTLLVQNAITSEQAATKQRELRLAFLETQSGLASGFEAGLLRMRESASGIADVVQQIGTGFSEAAARALLFGESFGDAFKRTVAEALVNVVSSLIAIGTQLLINIALAKLFGIDTAKSNPKEKTDEVLKGIAASTAASLASLAIITVASSVAASTVAAAWAPAAAAASLASFGANAVPATAGIVSTFAAAQALSSGGGVPGLAHGGSITVGGAGGVDNNLLSINGVPAARVSRSETVTVSPNRRGESSGNTVIYLDLKGSETGVEERVRDVLADVLPELQAQSSEDMEKNIVALFERERL